MSLQTWRGLARIIGQFIPPLPIAIGLVVFISLEMTRRTGEEISGNIPADFSVMMRRLVPGTGIELELGAGSTNPVATVMQVGISLVLLVAALWVILSKRYAPTDRHWAYGTIGTVVGYWLGGGR